MRVNLDRYRDIPDFPDIVQETMESFVRNIPLICYLRYAVMVIITVGLL